MTVSPKMGIKALLTPPFESDDPEIIRAEDNLYAYSLMWSPPYFRTPDDTPDRVFVDLMRTLAVDGVTALMHSRALGDLDRRGQHARLVAFVPMEDAKPLAKMGATCLMSGLYGDGYTTLRTYPLAVGYLQHFDEFGYVHPEHGQLYDELAARYNDVTDVNDGLLYLERNLEQKNHYARNRRRK